MIVPEGVTEIPEYAFAESRMLRTVRLPDSLVKIGASAFRFCYNLEEVNIPDGITEIDDTTFELCTLKEVHLPDGITRIGKEAFRACRKLKSINLPDSITLLDWGAFSECGEITEIHVPKNVKKIDVNAFNKLYKLKSVTLPEGLEELSGFSNCTGLTEIIIPESVTTIVEYAFFNCTGLTSIVIPDAVTSINDNAFAGCTALHDITIGDNVARVGSEVFTNTAFFNDPDNWHDDALYLKNNLIRVSSDVEYVKQVIDEKAAADVISYLPKAKSLTISGFDTIMLPQNLETLTILKAADLRLGYYNLPFTLKKVVIGPQVKMSDQAFKEVYNITIYVESVEKDVRWDENYPGWSHGNRAYYGDKWVRVRFHDDNGRMMSDDIYLTSQLIRVPYYKPQGDEYTEYKVTWDHDGDGKADDIPATSTVDLSLFPILVSAERKYSIVFTRDDGTVISYQRLSYGETITAPSPRERTGYDFMGYNGYTDKMTVTGSERFSEVWVHKDGGHNYTHTKVEASCDHDGYDEYVCPVCNESYVENVVPVTEHTFGVWTVEKAPTCSGHGTEKRVCGICGYEETRIIAPLGHVYVSSAESAATCTHEGIMKYKCSICGEEYSERTEIPPHRYKKYYKDYALVEDIINDLNCFYGMDGENCYFYVCEDCGKYMMPDEYTATTASARIASVACRHTYTETIIQTFDNCEEEGIEMHVCKKCGKTVNVHSLKAGTHTFGDPEWIWDNGYETAKAKFRCTACSNEKILDAAVTKTENDTVVTYTSIVKFNGVNCMAAH